MSQVCTGFTPNIVCGVFLMVFLKGVCWCFLCLMTPGSPLFPLRGVDVDPVGAVRGFNLARATATWSRHRTQGEGGALGLTRWGPPTPAGRPWFGLGFWLTPSRTLPLPPHHPRTSLSPTPTGPSPASGPSSPAAPQVTFNLSFTEISSNSYVEDYASFRNL